MFSYFSMKPYVVGTGQKCLTYVCVEKSQRELRKKLFIWILFAGAVYTIQINVGD